MKFRPPAQIARACLAASLVTAAVAAPPFAERITRHDPVRLWMFPDSALEMAGEVEHLPGPDPALYPSFPDPIRAAQFDGASYFRVPGSGADPAFQFTNGDTITIEACLRCDEIAPGQNRYVIGKGRTHRDGFAPDNQNWALRIRGEGGQARLSFLFRSEPDGDRPGSYHRWTSDRGFAPGSRWHHLAVTYQFGNPDSITAWVDGKKTSGSWDRDATTNGPTTRPPVVDADEVWIGSALGGSRGNSLQGALAYLALYRHAVPGMEEAYEARRYIRPLDLAAVPAARVLVELFRADSGTRDWPAHLSEPLRTLDAEALALFNLPPVYGPGGRRLDHSGVYLSRLAARVTFPPGEHELLLRAPGLAQLTIGDELVLSLQPAQIIRDAHGPLREIRKLPYPLPRLGTREQRASYHSDGNPVLVVIEALLGDPGGKVQVGELLLAARPVDDDRFALASPGALVPFTPEALELYKQDERDHHDALNAHLRHSLASRDDTIWKQRHERARAHLASLPAIEIPPPQPGASRGTVVDRFLQARIAAANAEAVRPPTAFQREILPVLEEHCFRCHGEKRKGGLRLDSLESALKGGDTGPAVVPRDPGASELLRRVRSADEDERMPPKGKPLSERHIAALIDWIASGAPWEAPAAAVTIPGDLDDRAFLRRLYLDTVGVFPSPAEVAAYLADRAPDKTARLVDRLLDDPRHAGHWVGYWQDVLAENPRLVKPTLNNTAPFRYWIHEALLDHMPMDRFVTELVTFAGGTYSGAAGGFRLATENDVPMAAKAHVLGTAFLGLEMKCARCHDAPFHSHTQKDLFSLAAMLKGAPLKVPDTSSVPAAFFEDAGGRQPRIKVTLDPHTAVPPAWPFAELAPVMESDPAFETPAGQLAYQITRPENRRFARVLVNRLWKRHFGQGLVEPAGDWEGHKPSHPELLDFLSRELVSNNYDLRHVSRLILNSAAYRRAPRNVAASSGASRFFEAPLRRRLTAEQLVDSLFAATGAPVFAEELTLDVEGWYPDKNFLNLGRPQRAWEFVSLSTERDRPSLTLPRAQAIVSFMEAYGWRANRAEPLTERAADPGVLQAGLLANGLLATWWTRLSDHSDLTELAVRAESPRQLVDALYLRLLTREPSAAEREALLAHLAPDFDPRLAGPPSEFRKTIYVPPVRHISWRNHLDPASNRLAAEIENEAAQGPPPTDFLSPGWRQRFEDAVWALLNSPEMQFVP